jgi:hypothetical protein
MPCLTFLRYFLSRNAPSPPSRQYATGQLPASRIRSAARRTRFRTGSSGLNFFSFGSGAALDHKSLGYSVIQVALDIFRAPLFKPWLHPPLIVSPAASCGRVMEKPCKRGLNGIDHAGMSFSAGRSEIARSPQLWISIRRTVARIRFRPAWQQAGFGPLQVLRVA